MRSLLIVIALVSLFFSSCTYCIVCDYTTTSGYASSEYCGTNSELDEYEADIEKKYSDVVCVSK